MKCIHLNVRSAAFLILAVLLHRIKYTHMADNEMEKDAKDSTQIMDNLVNITSLEDKTIACPSDMQCHELNYPCIKCNLTQNCIYGKEENVTCEIIDNSIKCKGERRFERNWICRYCYQTEDWEHRCLLQSNCKSVSSPRKYYSANCSVQDEVICLGRRQFHRRMLCNWTSGYRWSTALALSITLGGFGADRFYLGHWQEGIGKLFSFGGLGVWTLIDVILISLHYLGPADGSLYL